MNMKKSGQVSLTTIIIIALLAISFGIVLFFWWQSNFGERADKEACHQSVVYRASVGSVVEKAGEYIPLTCKTDKICITSGIFGGSCADFKGLKGITRIRVKNINQIQQAMAQNIVDCWTMMGEGHISLFSQWAAQTYGIGSVYPSCVICSRMAFDMESLKKNGINETELAKIDLDSYMSTHLIPNQQITYNELLSGESPAKATIKPNILSPDVSVESLSDVQSTSENLALQSKEIAVLFMQISSPSHGEAAKNVGLTALGVATGAFTTSAMTIGIKATVKAGMRVGKLCLSGGWVGPAICGGILAIAGIYQQSNIAVQRAKTAGYCGDVITGEDARNGCSIVRTIAYNSSEINQYCVAIESIA